MPLAELLSELEKQMNAGDAFDLADALNSIAAVAQATALAVLDLDQRVAALEDA